MRPASLSISLSLSLSLCVCVSVCVCYGQNNSQSCERILMAFSLTSDGKNKKLTFSHGAVVQIREANILTPAYMLEPFGLEQPNLARQYIYGKGMFFYVTHTLIRGVPGVKFPPVNVRLRDTKFGTVTTLGNGNIYSGTAPTRSGSPAGLLSRY